MENIQDWKNTDINVDSLWLIDKRNSTRQGDGSIVLTNK